MQQADVFARECATSLTFTTAQKTGAKAATLPTAAAPSASGTGAAEAAAKQEGAKAADAAAGAAPAADGTPEAAAHADAEPPAAAAGAGVAPQAVRNVTHREFVNLCHNWQKVGGQRLGARRVACAASVAWLCVMPMAPASPHLGHLSRHLERPVLAA